MSCPARARRQTALWLSPLLLPLFASWLLGIGCSSTSNADADAGAGADAQAAPDADAATPVDDGGTKDADAADAGPATLTGPIKSVTGGARHTCAIYENGALGCWGGNDNGQLGLGDTTDRGDGAHPVSSLTAVDLGSTSPVVEVALGERHTCARFADGRIKCWGSNDQGQLGDGIAGKRGDGPGEMGATLPFVDLGPGRTAKQITGGAAHTCALLDDAQIKCWGRNATGQLGLGDTTNRGSAAGQMGAALPAVDVGPGRTVLEVHAGDSFTCARLDDASVRCWGANGEGELGIGTSSTRGHKAGDMGANLTPVPLGTGRTATALWVGSYMSCAKLDTGGVKCWGGNAAGQLGLGDVIDRGTAPADMGDALPEVSFGAGRKVVALSLGQEFGCVLLDDDAMKCWGNSFYGQTGQGSTARIGDGANEMGDALIAVKLGTGRKAKSLGLGAEHTCIVTDQSKVKCWGGNLSAQLGNGNRNAIGDGPNEMGDSLLDLALP